MPDRVLTCRSGASATDAQVATRYGGRRAEPSPLHLADPRECPVRGAAGAAQAAGLAAGHGHRARPENLDGLNGPFVMVSNHSCHLDAPLLYRLAAPPAGPLRRRRRRRRLLLRRLVAQGPHLAVLQRLPGRPDRSAGQARHGHQPARRRRTAAAVPRGHPLADRRDGQLQARRRRAVHQPRRALRAGRASSVPPTRCRAARLAARVAAGLRRLRRADARRGRGEGGRVLRPDRQGGPRPGRLRHELPGAAAALADGPRSVPADGPYGRVRRRTHDRRQAHEVVGLGRRGRRLPPRGQARLSRRS